MAAASLHSDVRLRALRGFALAALRRDEDAIAVLAPIHADCLHALGLKRKRTDADEKDADAADVLEQLGVGRFVLLTARLVQALWRTRGAQRACAALKDTMAFFVQDSGKKHTVVRKLASCAELHKLKVLHAELSLASGQAKIAYEQADQYAWHVYRLCAPIGRSTQFDLDCQFDGT